MQQSRPLAYFSKCLGPKNAETSVYEKEAMAILEALKKWIHYFLGNKLIIKTDQSSLKYLASQKLLEGIQHKLMLKLLEFDFSIQYKKGCDNRAADALSRKFQPVEQTPTEATPPITCRAITLATPTWASDITTSYVGDTDYSKLLQEVAINPTNHANYTVQNGILRFKGRIVIGSSTDLRKKLFDTFHSSTIGGHSGNRVTYQKLKHLFFWPKMKQYLEQLIPACPVCQISKTERVPYPGLLDPLPIPATKWASISMNFVEGLPKSHGKDVILVVVDRLTKYAHFLSLAHPYTVQKIAQIFVDNILKLHGPPTVIITDRDRIFLSKLWTEIFSAMKISLHFSTAYHPESDGQTERVNQCMEQYLRCMAFQEPKQWSKWLPAAEFWYNTSFHTAIKMYPFEALYEYPPPLLTELPTLTTLSTEAQQTLLEKEHMITILQQNLAKAHHTMKKYADQNRTPRSFLLGDMVYLKM
jgi:hypothetical protein